MAIVAGGIVFALLLFFSLLDRTGRVLSLAVTCGALLVSVTVGFVKPMFKPPVFTANLVLFLVLGAAFGISAHFTRAVRTAAMTLIVGLAACTLPWSQRLLPAENYRPAGEFVAANGKAGDVVVVPNISVYWGMLRYAVGAAWGHPLDVMPPSNEAWTALKKRFGPDLVALSRLDPRSDFVERDGVRYVVGRDAAAHTRIVNRSRYDEAVHVAHPVVSRGVTWFGDELSVNRMVPGENGSAIISNPP